MPSRCRYSIISLSNSAKQPNEIQHELAGGVEVSRSMDRICSSTPLALSFEVMATRSVMLRASVQLGGDQNIVFLAEVPGSLQLLPLGY
jgi:hypothetical protein